MQRLFVVAAAAVTCTILSSQAPAQGNFDPAAARERMMTFYRERLDVKSDDDWKKIEPLIVKVTEAQRDTRAGGAFGGFGGRGGRGGTGAAAGGDNAAAGGGNRNRGGGQPNPDQEALQKAIDDKAPADEVKAKLAKYRESRKAREATLEKAQEELKKALSQRQEGSAVLVGLLK